MLNHKLPLSLLIIFLISCSSKSLEYHKIKSYDDNGHLQAIIEIPAGTNAKIEYNSKLNQFQQDSINGQPRSIQFLPYPVNYGFIPSTKMLKAQNGDGDPLDVLVLSKVLKTGQVLSVKPIGLLKMKDGQVWDNKVLSIPIDKKFQTLDIKNFKDFSSNHNFMREMIGKWFQHYDKMAQIEILGWSDESLALKEVEKWQIKSN